VHFQQAKATAGTAELISSSFRLVDKAAVLFVVGVALWDTRLAGLKQNTAVSVPEVVEEVVLLAVVAAVVMEVAEVAVQ
jgi:hypothetical protein